MLAGNSHFLVGTAHPTRLNLRKKDTVKLSKTDLASATLEGIEIHEPFGTVVDVPEDYSEIDIFCLFQARLGRPNGPMTSAIGFDGDPNAPWKWDFIFSLPGIGTIEVCRSWKHIELHTRRVTVSKEELLGFLTFNLEIHKEKIAEARKALEDYCLIINPYKRHKLLAKSAKEDLDSIKVIEPYYPESMMASSDQIRLHNESIDAYKKAMDKETAYSITLCTHSAYMVEAYLNLMLAIFIRPEIKEDKSIFKETIERRWKLKLRRLHLDFRYVSKADLGSAIVRNVENMFRLRNKVAHSYPDKDDLTVAHMWFFKNFPILNNPVPFDKYQIAMNNRLPTRQQAQDSYDDALKMVEFLLSLIDKNVKEHFEFLAESNPIGFNEAKGLYSIPFGQRVHKVFFP